MSILNLVSNVQGTIGGAKNLVNSLLSFFGVDVVGVFDNDTFEQLFITARPMKANVTRQQKIMDHPIESGAIVSDFAIILPVEIELSMLLTGQQYTAMYQEISTYFNTQQLVSIQTKATVFPNMMIQAMPHEETPEMFDVLPLALKFREVQMVTVQYQALPPTAVQTPTDTSTVQRGTQQPQQSILYGIGSFVGGIFK
jgi:hypothetical protein